MSVESRHLKLSKSSQDKTMEEGEPNLTILSQIE